MEGLCFVCKSHSTTARSPLPTHSHNERCAVICTYLPTWSYPGKVQERGGGLDGIFPLWKWVQNIGSREVCEVNNLNTIIVAVHHHTTTAAHCKTVRTLVCEFTKKQLFPC